MGNVVNIDDFKRYKMSEVICTKCGKRWICVRPFGTWLKNLECPNCGPGFAIETGEVLHE